MKTHENRTLYILALAILAILLLGQPSQAQTISTDTPYLDPGPADQGLTPEQHHAAMVAAGEAPSRLLGPAAYIDVLCIMRNRLESPDYPDTLAEVVAQGFYAPARPLTAWEYNAAGLVWDPANGCGGSWMYVLSLQDVAAHGLPPGDAYSETVTLASGTQLGLVYYTSNPWAR